MLEAITVRFNKEDKKLEENELVFTINKSNNALEELIYMLLSHNVDRYNTLIHISEEHKEYLPLCSLYLDDPEWEVRLRACQVLVESQYWLWDNQSLVVKVTERILYLLTDEHSVTSQGTEDLVKDIPIQFLINSVNKWVENKNEWAYLIILRLAYSLDFKGLEIDLRSIIKTIKNKRKHLNEKDTFYFQIGAEEYDYYCRKKLAEN
jgi:hypothetical protein